MRADRLQISVSPAMLAALQILAERSGVPRSTQAMISLRGALHKTIQTDECQRRIAEARPMLNTAQRRNWAEVEHFVESAYESHTPQENQA